MKKCRALEKLIKKEILHSKRQKIKQEAELGGKNQWKAVRLAQNRPVVGLPEEIKLSNGSIVKMTQKKLKNSQNSLKSK
jgi:hypothetical protein